MLAVSPVPTLGLLLHDVARGVRQRFDMRARSLGVTRQQWRTLIAIARAEGASQAELAERLEVERITLCRMIDRLADAGLVERRADPRDRRIWRVHLRPDARTLVERLREVAVGVEEEILADFPAEERASLVAGLNRLREALRQDRSTQAA